jgi:hypothetical protein
VVLGSEEGEKGRREKGRGRKEEGEGAGVIKS